MGVQGGKEKRGEGEEGGERMRGQGIVSFKFP